MTSVYRGSETDQIVDGMIANMKFQIENPALLNSRFGFNEFLYLDVNFHQLNLTRGSSYLPLPDWLARKKAIVHPHNDDRECFKWSVITAGKVGMKDPQRVSNLRKFTDNYDWSGLEFLVSIKDIGKFENRNNISVNVLAFRDTCLKHYKLDPAHFYTSPGLAWKACLKHTGIRLELLTNPDMLLMFEQGIRGGITQAVRKYASANNKYMGDKFNPNEDTTYLQYLDANNLYGWAMSQPLPTGGFKSVDVNPNEISELATRTDKGYLLEVDVSYPKELHNPHNDLPFMCERMEINGVEKLVPNLRDKKNYVIHI